MANYNIYKLHFTSPLHIGDKREDYVNSFKTISSDTFYAAITACLAKTGTKIPEDGDLGFAMSSLFPYYQSKGNDSTPIFFFPKPISQQMPNLKDLTKAKQVKKVEWLDKSFFEKILNGNQLFDNNENEVNCIQGKYLSDTRIDKDFLHSQIIQRVTISRTGEEDAKPFYMERISFKEKSGLFFIVEGNTELLDKGIKLLCLEGIGTDRNVGNGYFTYEKESIELNIPQRSEYSICMSLFIPESKEQFSEMISSDLVTYDFDRRGGWITSFPNNSIRKNVIYGITPGSLLKAEGPTVKGRIVDLKPQLGFGNEIGHPIWRCGKALFLPVKK